MEQGTTVEITAKLISGEGTKHTPHHPYLGHQTLAQESLHPSSLATLAPEKYWLEDDSVRLHTVQGTITSFKWFVVTN